MEEKIETFPKTRVRIKVCKGPGRKSPHASVIRWLSSLSGAEDSGKATGHSGLLWAKQGSDFLR